MVVYQFRAKTFPETEISYHRFFSGTRKRNVKKRDFRFFYYLDMIWAYLWPSRLNITPSSSQPNLNLPSSQSRNPSILLIKKRFFSVYPETKRNDCYISGTRKETTFFNGRLILETGTKRERKCRFHYLCLLVLPPWKYCPYCLPRTLGVQAGNNFKSGGQTGH